MRRNRVNLLDNEKCIFLKIEFRMNYDIFSCLYENGLSYSKV